MHNKNHNMDFTRASIDEIAEILANKLIEMWEKPLRSGEERDVLVDFTATPSIHVSGKRNNMEI